MAELSVFIDESGDFGPYEHHAPYYIITLVFHNQDKDISGPMAHLRRHIGEIGLSKGHAMPEADVRKVRPSDYSLFQAADLLCTLTLAKQKLVSPEGLSASETEFFLNARNLKKNYLKPMQQKQFDF